MLIEYPPTPIKKKQLFFLFPGEKKQGRLSVAAWGHVFACSLRLSLFPDILKFPSSLVLSLPSGRATAGRFSHSCFSLYFPHPSLRIHLLPGHTAPSISSIRKGPFSSLESVSWRSSPVPVCTHTHRLFLRVVLLCCRASVLMVITCDSGCLTTHMRKVLNMNILWRNKNHAMSTFMYSQFDAG